MDIRYAGGQERMGKEREAVVGVAMRNPIAQRLAKEAIPVNDSTMRLPLQKHACVITVSMHRKSSTLGKQGIMSQLTERGYSRSSHHRQARYSWRFQRKGWVCGG